MGPECLLDEAASLIDGDRNEDYGDYAIEARRIAASWSTLLNCHIPPLMVPLMMMQVKFIRESHRHKDDNIVDIEGYARLATRLMVALKKEGTI